jgi:hypothetical protein
MTDYKDIDPVLMAWARQRSVHIYTRYKECEVRLISIYEPAGQRQMSIDPIDESGKVGVHAYTFDDWRLDLAVPLAQLVRTLDEVYDTMISRIPTSFAHLRTLD